MNLLCEVFSTLETKDENVLKLRQMLADKKIPVGRYPDYEDPDRNFQAFKNKLPFIPRGRDVFEKKLETCPIRFNWKKKPIPVKEDGSLDWDSVYKNMKPQYYCAISVCDKDYTKNKKNNVTYISIIYDNEKLLKEHMAFFSLCFKTLDEINKEKERAKLLKTQKINKIHKLTNNQIYDYNSGFNLEEYKALA